MDQHLHEVDSGSTEKGAHTDSTGLHWGSGVGGLLRAVVVVIVVVIVVVVASGCSASGKCGAHGRLARREGSLRDGGSTLECWGTLIIVVVVGVRGSHVAGVEHLVDDVDDTVGDQDISGDDLGVVNENTLVADGDGEHLAVGGGELSAVHEAGRVADGAGDNMVGQDAGEVLGGQVAESRANVLESLVGGSEDGDIGGGVDGVDEVSSDDGTTEGGETSSGEDIGRDHGDGQHSVDDVNDTTSEVYVLRLLVQGKMCNCRRYIQLW